VFKVNLFQRFKYPKSNASVKAGFKSGLPTKILVLLESPPNGFKKRPLGR
jgi:hypothetical protein